MSEETVSYGKPSAEYDISMKLIPYMDPHMAAILLDSLAEKNIYQESDITNAKKTVISSYKSDEAAIENSKLSVGSLLSSLPSSQDSLSDFSIQSAVEKIKSISPSESEIASLPVYAKALYNAGQYALSRVILQIFRRLTTDENAASDALWGCLAASIIDNKQDAIDDARVLRENIDTRVRPYSEQTLSRAWFLHWILFVAFVFPGGKNLLLDTISHNNNTAVQTDRLLSVVQNDCQHLTRYIAVAALTTANANLFTKRISTSLRDLIRIISSEDIIYSDPIVEFVRALLIDFDFPKAAQCLNEARSVFATDYFLSSKTITKEFFDSARVLFLSTYARVNTEADISNLLTQFNIVGYEDSPAPAVSNKYSSTTSFAPASAHAQIRDRSRNIVYRSNNILDKDKDKEARK